MAIYIRAAGNISPQKTFGQPPLLHELVLQQGDRMRCTEPDYQSYIDVKNLRRMSRIIRMGTAAALDCLREAGNNNPDAIVMGTAYGCLEDTGIFLKKMVEQQEEMLTPTSFIQSTHNTIGAQIALLLQCHQYNNTFVHRGWSFESALLDAMMLLNEGSAETVLTGAADEITEFSHAILSRFGLYRKAEIANTDLLESPGKGTIAGEGAAFFLLAATASETDYAVLEGLHTFYKPSNTAEIGQQILSFLEGHGLSTADIDIVLTGRNGDAENDAVYEELASTHLQNIPIAAYKQLCGEYPTSTAFALWLAAAGLKQGLMPAITGVAHVEKLRRVLIYNHYQGIHHSLMLVRAC